MVVNQRIKVDNPREVTALTFLQHGQRYESWLPAGVWEFAGKCNVSGGCGDTKLYPAIMLVACGAGRQGTWYIGEASARKLGFCID